MIDIISADSSGMQVFDTQVYKGKNVLSVQLGSLEYAQLFGIDLRYFLTEGVKFQDASFKAYTIERLATAGINVTELIEVIESLDSIYKYTINPEENSTGMVAR